MTLCCGMRYARGTLLRDAGCAGRAYYPWATFCSNGWALRVLLRLRPFRSASVEYVAGTEGAPTPDFAETGAVPARGEADPSGGEQGGSIATPPFPLGFYRIRCRDRRDANAGFHGSGGRNRAQSRFGALIRVTGVREPSYWEPFSFAWLLALRNACSKPCLGLPYPKTSQYLDFLYPVIRKKPRKAQNHATDLQFLKKCTSVFRRALAEVWPNVCCVC